MKKVWIALVCLLTFTSIHADDVYVKAKYAKLRKHPKKSTGTTKVDRGTKLQKTKKVRDWYQVKYKGKKRWVYKGKVDKNQPNPDKSLVVGGSMKPDFGDEIATGSAVRGLSKVALQFSKNQNVSDKHQAYMDYHQSYITTDKADFSPQLTSRGIELVKIDQSQLERFQEEGKLGIFANAGDDSEFEEED